ncbi:MAG: glycosyltransferase family 9 protein [Bacteroidales bacterium]|jgi:ADP-heptose:LPS heptosyltransferase|nr:glycosyltransferase family 9 protein [Bacteroidales bacterium]
MIIPKRIIISRTDGIGDVMLTLPLAGILKDKFPGCKIIFLGNDYTKDVISCSEHIDDFVSYSEIEKIENNSKIEYFKSLNADTILHVYPKKEIAKLAKKSGIKNRIGTSHRYYHLTTCNHLVSFSRKHSDLHEAQLNTKLLKPLIDIPVYSLNDLNDFSGFTKIKSLNNSLKSLLSTEKKNIILHPKSKGSAREWGADNFTELINLLPEEKYNIFITGSQKESEEIKQQLQNSINRHVHYLFGTLTLSELISFIKNSDILVACSTGPLHIASMAGINTIGIYPPIKPMHPGRWKPIGKKSKVFVENKECNECRKLNICECIKNISPFEIKNYCDKL